jgi:hypothetical protein
VFGGSRTEKILIKEKIYSGDFTGMDEPDLYKTPINILVPKSKS